MENDNITQEHRRASQVCWYTTVFMERDEYRGNFVVIFHFLQSFIGKGIINSIHRDFKCFTNFIVSHELY